MAKATARAKVADFRHGKSTWCAGCGDFGVLAALQRAAAELDLTPDDICLVSGIGCSGKINSYFASYGFHGVHGRALPVATGVKLANRHLTVVAAGGDGDGYAIGLSHFIHAVRRNIDLVYIVMDNNIYGLTTGQASPTSPPGLKTKTSPGGAVEEPVSPLELALVSGGTFVAQGFSSELGQLAALIKEGIQHPGFAFINCISPCVTFNKQYGYDFYKEKLVNVEDDPDYRNDDRGAALKRVRDSGGMLRGLIFRDPHSRSYEQRLFGYAEEPLTQAPLRLDAAQWAELLQGMH